MPNVHPYLPEDLYKLWKPTFEELKIDPSTWVQKQFKELLEQKTDLITLQQQLLEKKQLFEQLQVEIENTTRLIEDVKILEERRKKQQGEAKKLRESFDPSVLANMAKSITKNYEVTLDEARSLAIEYLSIPNEERPYLLEFMNARDRHMKQQEADNGI